MRSRLAWACAAALIVTACHRKQVSSLDRKEAANVVSEAEFAMNLKDWSRAEGLYAKAASLCPDAGDYWINLGMVRMRLHDSDGARSAYRWALSAYQDDGGRHPESSVPVIRRAYVLVLLGRVDEARSAIDQAHLAMPNDRNLRNFIEAKQLERWLSDPQVKERTP